MDSIREKVKDGIVTKEEYRLHVIQSTIEYLSLNQDYDFVRVVGHGSFGLVAEIKNRKKNRSLAAKLVLEEHADKNENEIWPNLGHPNLLPLISLDYIASTGSFVYITPLHSASLADIVEGSHLAEDRNGIERAISWQQGVSSGLHYLHSRNLCHLDLKLSNVLISQDDTAIICDFGSITRTENGVTDRYISPYFYRPQEGLESKSGRNAEVNGFKYDVYTFGIMCMELFTKEALGNSLNWENRRVSWRKVLYPKIFDILEKKQFEVLTKRNFLMSDVKTKTLCDVRDFIRGCIHLNPARRPSVEDLLRHKLFGGRQDFRAVKNDAWIVRCDPSELKLLINFYVRRSLAKDFPSKDIEKIETEEADEESVRENIGAIAAQMDSSCKKDEPEFVEVEEKTKKQKFFEWVGRKKSGLIETVYRLCCCCHKRKKNPD